MKGHRTSQACMDFKSTHVGGGGGRRRRKVYSGANAVNEEDPERERATQGGTAQA